MRLNRLLRSELFWVLGALALRAAFALRLGGRFYQADENGFTAVARSLACSGVYGIDGEPTVGALGAPLFFSAFYRLWDGPQLARLAQAVLATATAWGIGRMTRDAADSRRAGLLALAVASVYPFFVYYSGMLMSETLYIAAAVAGLWALARSLRERGAVEWRAAAAGLALSAAGLTRTEGVPIALVLWGALALLCLLRRYAWRSLVLAVVCWALPLGGWAARNGAVSGKATLDLHGGYTLLCGTMYFEQDQQDTVFCKRALEASPLYREARGLGEAQRDALYFSAALNHMREHPAATLRQWGRKTVNFWRLYPRTDKVYPDDAHAQPSAGASRRALVAVSLVFEPLLIFAGLAGAWRLRRRLHFLFPFYWLVLATFAVHVIVVSQMRYRLPVMPFMILFACAWADRVLPGAEEDA
ncbi:MAG: hypothetical protein ABIJ96_05485 [Elusimicrobiota bacterium]